MGKRRIVHSADQFGFSFDPPKPARHAADLAGLRSLTAAAVSKVLQEETRDRDVIAAEMGVLLVEKVTGQMLDGYASVGRDTFNISFHRLAALIAVTNRYDELDALLRRIGAALLVGEEIHTARLGHIDRQIADLQAQKKALQGTAKPIMRGR